MVDSMEIHKSLKIDNRTVMKNLEMLKFVPDHLKTNKMYYIYNIYIYIYYIYIFIIYFLIFLYILHTVLLVIILLLITIIFCCYYATQKDINLLTI